MKTIVITSTSGLWDEAQKVGEYRQSTINSTLDDVGFIHATSPDQTTAMLNRHFVDRNDILLLVVDPNKVKPEVKLEAPLSGSSGVYPHIYGPLNVDAVIDTYVPARDSSGKFTDSKSKTIHDSATPTPGQQVITACAFIHREIKGVQKVFMAKRADTKKFLPGVYELPGGHIDFGETAEDGLVREINEEFGIDVHLGDPFAVFTYANEIKGSHSIEVIYFAQLVNPDVIIQPNPEDHSTCDWFSEEELPQTFVSEKDIEDDEVKAIYKGFALLAGDSVDFGKVDLPKRELR